MNWIKGIGLPLAYLLAVIWALRPPPPSYVAQDKTVVSVTDAGTPTLLHSPSPIYPTAALHENVEGSVKLRVTIDENGGVSHIESIAGPELLRAAAETAVRGWQFTAVPAETEIDVPFLLWHPGPREVRPAAPIEKAPANAGPGRHGIVRLVASIGESGTVESAEAVAGPKHLRAAAISNVRKWKFRPELQDGKPARSTTVVNVEF